MVSLQDIQAAQARIHNHIRHTPLVEAKPVKQPVCRAETLYLKLECLQICGSFKARGAVNKLLSIPPEQLQRGLVTASGGNHGLGVAYAGWLAGVPTTIYLPVNTPPVKARRLELWGARVVFHGDVWDDANRAALAAAEELGLAYVHPFADPAVIAGQGTVALEILEEWPEVELLIVPIGGGGLAAGIALAAKALKPEVRVVGVEPVGAPTLSESLRAGRLVEL